MKKRFLFSAIALLVLPLYDCTAYIGKPFNYQNRYELVIGKTSKEDVLQLFDKSHQSNTISNDDGDFDILQYQYTYTDRSGAAGRILILELRNGLLNAYLYSSGFPEDATDFNYEASDNIKRKASNKQDLLDLMGPPSGKAMCPSTFFASASKCESGYEIWIWVYTCKSKGYDEKTVKSKSLKVTFDKDEMVSGIERINEN